MKSVRRKIRSALADRVLTGSLVAGIAIVGLGVTGCGTGSSLSNSGSAGGGSSSANSTGSAQSGATGSQSSQGSGAVNASSGTGKAGANPGGTPSAGAAGGATASSSAVGGRSGSTSSNQAVGNQAGTMGQTASTGWPQPGQWLHVSVTKLGQLPYALLGNALAMDPNGHPVSVGGYTGQASISGIYQLLPKVTKLAALQALTHDAAAGFTGGSLYVIGGGQAASYNSVVAVQNGKAKKVATLSRPLSDAVSVPLTVNGKSGLALVGGYDGSVFRSDTAFMTVSSTGKRTWSTLFTLNTPVRYPAVASHQDTLYIAGGMKQHGLSDQIDAWSASDGKLKTVGTLPSALQKAALFAAGPYLIVIGGETTSGQPQSNILEIDTRTGQSKVVGKFPTPIADMGYTQSNQQGYLAGGITTSSDSSASRAIYSVSWKS